MRISEVILERSLSEGPISAIKGAVNRFKQDAKFGQDYVDAMAQQQVDRETKPATGQSIGPSPDRKKTAFTNRLSGQMTDVDIVVFKQLINSKNTQLAAAAKNASRSLPLSSADERVLQQELKNL